MPATCLIRTAAYHDSVALMQLARALRELPGVQDAAAVMGTPANRAILADAGLLTPEAESAGPGDLVIAISAADEAALQAAVARAEALLARRPGPAPAEAADRPPTLAAALRQKPDANLALVSVAGRYAVAEARRALAAGLHVFLFSDNVSLADEVALKREALDRGLLLMGPGAGTAIVNGVGLGFANAVPRGPVGLVAAAGTGLQEVACLLARHGIGVSQALGVGGRDLSEAVGGMMTLAGLRALQHDPATRVICLIARLPAPAVAGRVLKAAETTGKPAVACFLGASDEVFAGHKVRPARTLTEAARLAVAEVEGAERPFGFPQPEGSQAGEWRARLSPGQRYVRGLFSGGTLCYEAQVVLRDRVGPACSNVPLDPAYRLADVHRSQGHTCLDMGEEEFTQGRPHPMIDLDLRARRIVREAEDPETAVILLDVVLGYGAHPDPAGELVPAIRRAQEVAGAAGRTLFVVASVAGTDADPQCRARQADALRQAGVFIAESNAAAAALAGFVVKKT